jgi:hypothetical protein
MYICIHMYLQHYKRDEFASTCAAYSSLSDSTQDDAETCTNMCAALIASGECSKAIEAASSQCSTADLSTDADSSTLSSATVEVLFNKACAEISVGDLEAAAKSLHTARDISERAARSEGSSDEEIAAETAPIAMQLVYVNLARGHRDASSFHADMEACKHVLRSNKTDLELSAVCANNLAALRGSRDIPDTMRRFRASLSAAAEAKLSAQQLFLARYNRAVLALHARKAEECFKILEELEKM